MYDVQGHYIKDCTLVTVFIDPDRPQGSEGFIRVDDYSVNRQVGPLKWQKAGKKTLTATDGGVIDSGRCLLGICAKRDDLKLSAVLSFYRAPGEANGPESPFRGANPRRPDGALKCTHKILQGGPNGEDVFFYPILGVEGSDGTWNGEAFANKGNYFYTACVRKMGTDKFFICDPEMEIGP